MLTASSKKWLINLSLFFISALISLGVGLLIISNGHAITLSFFIHYISTIGWMIGIGAGAFSVLMIQSIISLFTRHSAHSSSLASIKSPVRQAQSHQQSANPSLVVSPKPGSAARQADALPDIGAAKTDGSVESPERRVATPQEFTAMPVVVSVALPPAAVQISEPVVASAAKAEDLQARQEEAERTEPTRIDSIQELRRMLQLLTARRLVEGKTSPHWPFPIVGIQANTLRGGIVSAPRRSSRPLPALTPAETVLSAQPSESVQPPHITPAALTPDPTRRLMFDTASTTLRTADTRHSSGLPHQSPPASLSPETQAGQPALDQEQWETLQAMVERIRNSHDDAPSATAHTPATESDALIAEIEVILEEYRRTQETAQAESSTHERGASRSPTLAVAAAGVGAPDTTGSTQEEITTGAILIAAADPVEAKAASPEGRTPIAQTTSKVASITAEEGEAKRLPTGPAPAAASAGLADASQLVTPMGPEVLGADNSHLGAAGLTTPSRRRYGAGCAQDAAGMGGDLVTPLGPTVSP